VEPGSQLQDYIIEAEIGGGGMAKVYRARHAVLDTHHALKVLDAEYRANAEARRRFLDEAKIQAKHLTHPNIVKVTNIVATADAAALVMELVDGGSLETYIQKRGKPFSGDELLNMAVPILDAMAHAHDAGIIHRDIKPANILLRKQDGRLVPAITDFGIAKLQEGGAAAQGKKRSTHHEARMGTLGYMSPEQIRKAKDVTVRSDIFSLGAMFYEMATGKAPFDGDSDYDVMENIVHARFEPPEKLADPKLPAHIIGAIKRAMEPDPARRWADCREFSEALTSGKPIKAAGVTATSFGGKSGPTPKGPTSVANEGGSKKALIVALGVGGAALAGVAIFLATKGGDEPTGGGGSAGSGSAIVQGGGGSGGGSGDTMVAAGGTDAGVGGADPWSPTADPHGQTADAAVDAEEIDAPPPVDAAVIDAPPKPPPPPPVVYTCKGRWSGSEIVLNISRSSGSCGKIAFTSGLGCSGELYGCRDGRTFSAGYNCPINGMPNKAYSGNLSMSCAGREASVSISINGSFSSKSVRR
jgi:serine/threonine-protein kinase